MGGPAHEGPDATPEFRLGVLFADASSVVDDDLDETGHARAVGRWNRSATRGAVAEGHVGEELLRAAALAVGREVAVVVSGVIAGLDARNGATPALQTGALVLDDLELTFGVKASLGAGKVVEAFLTATTEATIQVSLKLRPADGDTTR